MLKADWTAKLLNYSIAEIDNAISNYVDDVKNRKAAHEGQIRQIIIANRGRHMVRQPVTKTPTPVGDRVSGERSSQIIRDAGINLKRTDGYYE